MTKKNETALPLRSVRELVRDGDWINAARREAAAAEADGYDVTAEILRWCVAEIERLQTNQRTGRIIHGDAHG